MFLQTRWLVSSVMGSEGSFGWEGPLMLGPYPTKQKAGPLLIFRAYFSESVSIFFFSLHLFPTQVNVLAVVSIVDDVAKVFLQRKGRCGSLGGDGEVLFATRKPAAATCSDE